jgi:hypothetical protein
MHIRSFPLAFGTTTGLANHSGWWTSSMKPACSNLWTSSRMKFCRSMDCFRDFCRTGLASGWIFRWCSITSLGIPGICDGSQANTSTFARRKVMSALSYFSPRFPPMRVVWEGSAPTWMVFTGTSSVSDG